MPIVRVLTFLLAIILIVGVLLDCFEAVVLPRRVTRPYRYSRLYYRNTWLLWRLLAKLFRTGRLRETWLSVFGPLSLLGLFFTWGIGLVFGFGLLSWTADLPLNGVNSPVSLSTYIYVSGTTFFTLGFGDITPISPFGRALAVVEAGLGFSFLAVVIGYLPVFYQSFSHREQLISLLDARAGSPPSAGEAIRRAVLAHDIAALTKLLAEGERWAAQVLESHLSYPPLTYFRSQHDNQSWLAAMTMMLDTSTLLIAGTKTTDLYQAQMTFAMARHVVVDLAMVLRTPPKKPTTSRMNAVTLCQVVKQLASAGIEVREEVAFEAKVAELHAMYEPFVTMLAEHLLLTLPPVVPETAHVDNWQTSAWMRRTPGIGQLPQMAIGDEHFD